MITPNEIKEFEQAINSDKFLYARKWRMSPCSDDYDVVAYLQDDISPTGKSGGAILPLKEALKVLKKNGKGAPLGSIV